MGDCKESEKPQTNLYVIRIGKGKVVDLRMGTFIWKYACGTMGYLKTNICQKAGD